MNAALTDASSQVPPVEVLDCTLRDGGYYTNWDFPPELMDVYFDSVAALPVRIVEVGYMSKPLSGYRGRHHYLGIDELEELRARLSTTQTLAVMIDVKNHSVADVVKLTQGCRDVVGLVRLAVAPDELDRGARMAEELSARGFSVAVNIMYLSNWWQHPARLPDIARLTEHSTVIAAVDSHGACEPAEVGAAVATLRTLAPRAKVGFHGHDNLGLALANSIAAVDNGATVIDATFSGMGRGAGNTSTQALLVRQAARRSMTLDLEALVAVDREFEILKSKHRWGPSLPYMLSGASGLPQKEVMEWVGKKRYAMESIVRALHGGLPSGLDQRLYPDLEETEAPRGVILIGGGPSVEIHEDALVEYVNRSGTNVVHASQRHLRIAERVQSRQIICLTGDGANSRSIGRVHSTVETFVAPPGPRLPGTVPPEAENKVRTVKPFELEGRPAQIGPVSDTAPLSLGLGVALALKSQLIMLIGFDGYDRATEAEQALAAETLAIMTQFTRDNPDIEVFSLTPNSYGIRSESIYARLSDVRDQKGGR